jgi:hypothetical protein
MSGPIGARVKQYSFKRRIRVWKALKGPVKRKVKSRGSKSHP